jgi:predicted phage terminase large subunit-like protein
VPVIPAQAVRPERTDKLLRARAIAPYFERGEVMLPAGAAWLADFEAEVCGFPLAPHDDQVDAMAYAILSVTQPGAGEFGEYLRMLKEKAR